MSKVAHAHPVEDAIRRSHCSHDDKGKPDHRCAGTCTISPKGMTLECGLCGGDFEASHPFHEYAGLRAKDILAAAGISWNMLSDEARMRAADVVRRTLCPGCGAETTPQRNQYSSYTCVCGEWWFSERWMKRL